jgi:hypothetical protein
MDYNDLKGDLINADGFVDDISIREEYANFIPASMKRSLVADTAPLDNASCSQLKGYLERVNEKLLDPNTISNEDAYKTAQNRKINIEYKIVEKKCDGEQKSNQKHTQSPNVNQATDTLDKGKKTKKYLIWGGVGLVAVIFGVILVVKLRKK